MDVFQASTLLLIALAAGATAITTGLWLFNRLRGATDWRTQLRAGNTASAIAITGAVLATALMVQGGLQGIIVGMFTDAPLSTGFIRLGLGYVLSLVVVNGGSRLFDLLTPNTPVFEALDDGNNAVAIGLAGFMVSLAWVVSSSISALG